jgi:hypothetical protein
MEISNFVYYILEREAILKKRIAMYPKPWTTDPILQAHHFCNNRRQDDRGTKEIQAVVKELEHNVENLPAVYTLARLFNKASTLRTILEGGDIKDVRAKGEPIFHVAYVVTTCGVAMDKVDYVFRVTNDVMLTRIPNGSLSAAYNALLSVDGLGSFLAGQVVADLKNDRYLLQTACPDWHSFSVMGPGSKKGLDYIYGDGRTSHGNYATRMQHLCEVLPQEIKELGLHRQDMQNCLCEFSKFMRYKNNDPGRRRYYQ